MTTYTYQAGRLATKTSARAPWSFATTVVVGMGEAFYKELQYALSGICK